jgi:AAA family ATP:ADP antiporter
VLIAETRVYYEILLVLEAHSSDSDEPSSRLLRLSLQERLQLNLERIFRLLGLVYPPKDIYNAYQGIAGGARNLQANAIEFLDNLLRSDIKRYLLPIIEDGSTEIALQRGTELFNLSRMSKKQAVAYLIDSKDEWLRACAVYSIRGVKEDELWYKVEKLRDDPDPIVKETAELVWRSRARSDG